VANRPVATAPTAASIVTSTSNKPSSPLSPKPTQQSKAATLNTNFCGETWSEHTKDCANSWPCPKGDECPVGEICFHGSPCAHNQDDVKSTLTQEQVVANRPVATASTVVATSSTSKVMLNPQTQPTPNPTPPPTPPPTPATSSYKLFQKESTKPTIEPPKRPIQQPEIANKTPATSAKPTHPISSVLPPEEANLESNKGSTAVVSGEVAQNQPVTSEATPQTQPVLDTCSLCGDSTRINSPQRVNLYGVNDISCGQFAQIFLSESILEGSVQCLNFRGEYSDKCCKTTNMNDPDQLCSDGSTKYTGYKPTRDCRGYVYCIDGYLMGGGAASESPSGISGGSGVIACWPNQLYDAVSGLCTYWQSVDTSECPDFDGSKMMPELTDKNANPGRFYCGVSASNAEQVCEACPGGSRLECSDPTHNCFASITGCAVDSSSPNNSAGDGSSSRGSPLSSTTTRTSDPTDEFYKWNTISLLSPASSIVVPLIWSICLPVAAGLLLI